ncbi:MAG TPA: hypothetical protein VFA59_24325 [Vicinamibacterales bacterium]|nr:hypothetical protein [Vicinamibacterales bacterium]
MNVKRTLVFVGSGAALIAWLAGAATSNREYAPPVLVSPPHVDVQGADLAKEIARLHERLRPESTPRQPGRNLFTFHAAIQHRPAIVESPTAAISEVPAPTAPPQPMLKLAGIAEDAGPNGPVRTAIISTDSQLFLVKEGEAVTARYRVAKIAPDVVELTDALDGTTRRLPLK